MGSIQHSTDTATDIFSLDAGGSTYQTSFSSAIAPEFHVRFTSITASFSGSVDTDDPSGVPGVSWGVAFADTPNISTHDPENPSPGEQWFGLGFLEGPHRLVEADVGTFYHWSRVDRVVPSMLQVYRNNVTGQRVWSIVHWNGIVIQPGILSQVRVRLQFERLDLE